jgi:hypothetical protein
MPRSRQVAAHLTRKLPIHRLPLSFTTRVVETGQTHRHIVLALVCVSHQRWGAMGMSRRADLMDKDLIFKSLSALVEEFRRAYCVCGHELVSVYVGLPFSSSPSCTLPVVWRALHIDLKSEEIEKEDTAFPASVNQCSTSTAKARRPCLLFISGIHATPRQVHASMHGSKKRRHYFV